MADHEGAATTPDLSFLTPDHDRWHDRTVRYIPADLLATPPGSGLFRVIKDNWWAVMPGKGLVFFGSSPQCNADRRITEVLSGVATKFYPGAVFEQVPVVFLPHRCEG